MSEGGVFDWATVERSDEPLRATKAQSHTEVLEVPELNEDSIGEIESALSEQPEQPTDDRQTGAPGSEVACVLCGKTVTVKRDGFLRQHKCEPLPQRGTRLESIPSRRPTTPKRVRDFSIGVIAWGVEEGAAHSVARAVGCDPQNVPSELPDAEGMIGPPLDLLWPSIPDSAQRFIAKIADEADLIACALAWGDWVRTLSKFAREQRALNNRVLQERASHVTSQSTGTDDIFGAVVPFTPAQP